MIQGLFLNEGLLEALGTDMDLPNQAFLIRAGFARARRQMPPVGISPRFNEPRSQLRIRASFRAYIESLISRPFMGSFGHGSFGDLKPGQG